MKIEFEAARSEKRRNGDTHQRWTIRLYDSDTQLTRELTGTFEDATAFAAHYARYGFSPCKKLGPQGTRAANADLWTAEPIGKFKAGDTVQTVLNDAPQIMMVAAIDYDTDYNTGQRTAKRYWCRWTEGTIPCENWFCETDLALVGTE